MYETISDRNIHYIKLIDMVTGKGYMDVNRISGYIPGKMVFYLMQASVCWGVSVKTPTQQVSPTSNLPPTNSTPHRCARAWASVAASG